MKQTQQITRPDLVAGCPLGADVGIEDVRPLAYAKEDQSGRPAYVSSSMDIVAKQDTQDVLARKRTERAYVTRPMTLDELTASIAHEVIQPLAAVVTHGDACLQWLGRDEPKLDEARANVAAMIRNALRSSDIIRRLRALSTKGDVQRRELHLNEVIAEVVPLIEPEALRNRVSLQFNLASELSLVLGDRVQLQQVIINLLFNSIQAMASVSDRPHDLLIRSQQHDVDHVVVVVEDNGTGIGLHDMDRLFDTFFTTKVDGTGIGLSICRSIIEAHGGRIWAARNIRHGAAFHFALPASRARAT